MDGGSGSGCGCCSCGCLGCLTPIIAIIMAIMMIFAVFTPMNRNFDHMNPNFFDEYYPDSNDGTGIPADKGSLLPVYELSESFTITFAAF
jgi:hypothetical protein